MNLNINLFVHGVPMGQKIWGPKGDDQNYLSSFYGPKWGVPEIMIVEIMTFGGIPYCYYSFIKGENVFDAQGRAGSYFALTLRMNAFYADIQNIYNILKTTYQKMCVGLCVQDTGNAVKYLCSDFQSVDSKLRNIEGHILTYISEFSIGTDIQAIENLRGVKNGRTQNINLFECHGNIAIETIRKQGKLLVSPCFLPESAAKSIAHFQAEIQVTQQRAQQEIQLQKQTAEQKLNETIQQSNREIESLKKRHYDALQQYKEQAQQQIAHTKEESEYKLSEIRRRYADVDSEIIQLKNTIKSKGAEIADCRSLLKKKDKELKSNESRMQGLQQQCTELQSELEEMKHAGNPQYPKQRKSKRLSNISKWTKIQISILCLLVSLAFIIGAYLLLSKNKSELQKKSEIKTGASMANFQKSWQIVTNSITLRDDSVVVPRKLFTDIEALVNIIEDK